MFELFLPLLMPVIVSVAALVGVFLWAREDAARRCSPEELDAWVESALTREELRRAIRELRELPPGADVAYLARTDPSSRNV